MPSALELQQRPLDAVALNTGLNTELGESISLRVINLHLKQARNTLLVNSLALSAY